MIKATAGGLISSVSDRERIEKIKARYPKGTRIILDSMGDDPSQIASRTLGTVQCVDAIGTIHCEFDNGRSLGLVPGEDSFHIVR